MYTVLHSIMIASMSTEQVNQPICQNVTSITSTSVTLAYLYLFNTSILSSGHHKLVLTLICVLLLHLVKSAPVTRLQTSAAGQQQL